MKCHVFTCEPKGVGQIIFISFHIWSENKYAHEQNV